MDKIKWIKNNKNYSARLPFDKNVPNIETNNIYNICNNRFIHSVRHVNPIIIVEKLINKIREINVHRAQIVLVNSKCNGKNI